MRATELLRLRMGGPTVICGWALMAGAMCFAQDTPQPAPAARPEAAAASSWWRGITTNGYVSLSYNHNTNNPTPRINTFRVFDFNEGDPQLDASQIVVQHAASNPGQFGFRLNMMAGSGVPEVTAAYGMFRNTTTGIASHFDIPEAYVSYVAPVAKGLRFDLGKFATPFGYEVIGGYDGYNEQYSRGFLFGYGVPFTHVGMKTSYSFNSRISAALLLTNGCDAFTRLNGHVTVAGQIATTTSKTTSLTFTFMHGPEKPHNAQDQRSLYELMGSWKAHPRLTFGFDALYADEDHAATDGSDAIWKGLAGYSKFTISKRLSLAFRGEVFTDSGGSRTGTSQTLRGFSVTPEYVVPVSMSSLAPELRHFNGKFIMRAEFRRDDSDRATFRTSSGLARDQFTTAVNVIYLF